VAPLAFDGATVLVTERGDREMRLQRVLADPGRHTASQLARALARGFDVACPGLGHQAAADLGRRGSYRVARAASTSARTVIEQLYARQQIGHQPVESDYNQVECIPFGNLRVLTLQQFTLNVWRRIATGKYPLQMFTRNLAYIMHPCDAAQAGGLTGDPDLPYVPRTVQPQPLQPLVFELKQREGPSQLTASSWFPDETSAAKILK
jgi:hypothetical protein